MLCICRFAPLVCYGSAAKIGLLKQECSWIEVVGAVLLFNSWELALSGGGPVSWTSSTGAVWMTEYGLSWCSFGWKNSRGAARVLVVLPPLVAARGDSADMETEEHCLDSAKIGGASLPEPAIGAS
ncbi:hypothetical protein Nepgr_009370 [Nepenthes gracilis]|uniref:Uncharacterized protein n=1 Tax=Nepenthes gracilis TaxID=150966 RepID=A0AAD3XKA2_NEPGR|nr:hypothetical protein Nepgr_009370 [Nepenthes gracilis]